jgi:hypothetical protein
MTSCLMEKRELLRRSIRRIRPHETVVEDFFMTAPRIDLTFVQKQKVRLLSVARPVVSPMEFETNPIVRIHPTIGKHYPIVIVRRSTASFKPTPIRVSDEDV